MKGLIGAIVGIFLVVIIIFGVIQYQNNNNAKNAGSLYVGVTDASADINNVNNIDMSVKKVEVYSDTKGWVTVSSSPKSYQLLSLKESGQTQLYAKSNIDSGTYNKVRVTLGDTIVNTKTKGDIKAVLPSSEIVMDTNITVNSGQDSHIKFDFLADKSLHTTTDGQYVFAPVVKAESTSNANVEVKSDGEVVVSGGQVDSNTEVGVDLNGSSKANFNLNTDNSLKIESSVNGALKFMLGGKEYSSSNEVTGNTESTTNASTDSNLNTSVDTNQSTGINSDSTTKVDTGLKNNTNLVQ